MANLFGHMTGRQKGMVQIWDVVGFDEVADLQKMPKEVITTMKTYCEVLRWHDALQLVEAILHEKRQALGEHARFRVASRFFLTDEC